MHMNLARTHYSTGPPMGNVTNTAPELAKLQVARQAGQVSEVCCVLRRLLCGIRNVTPCACLLCSTGLR